VIQEVRTIHTACHSGLITEATVALRQSKTRCSAGKVPFAIDDLKFSEGVQPTRGGITRNMPATSFARRFALDRG
jgi:hypothetical protein